MVKRYSFEKELGQKKSTNYSACVVQVWSTRPTRNRHYKLLFILQRIKNNQKAIEMYKTVFVACLNEN